MKHGDNNQFEIVLNYLSMNISTVCVKVILFWS